MGRIRLTRLVVVFGLLLTLAQVAAQAPDIAWTRQFGTSGWDKAAG